MNVKLNDILVCHKSPYKYSGFEVGSRYKVLTHLTSKYDPDRDFVYILNDRYLSIRFDISDLPEYFLHIREWRDRKLKEIGI